MNTIELISLFFFLILIFLIIKNRENFTLSPHISHDVYQRYRNYIDSNFKPEIRFNTQNPILFNNISNIKVPYRISPNCFDDRYNKCFYYRKDNISNKQRLMDCEKMSLNSCIIPLMTSENYMSRD